MCVYCIKHDLAKLKTNDYLISELNRFVETCDKSYKILNIESSQIYV